MAKRSRSRNGRSQKAVERQNRQMVRWNVSTFVDFDACANARKLQTIALFGLGNFRDHRPRNDAKRPSLHANGNESDRSSALQAQVHIPAELDKHPYSSQNDHQYGGQVESNTKSQNDDGRRSKSGDKSRCAFFSFVYFHCFSGVLQEKVRREEEKLRALARSQAAQRRAREKTRSAGLTSNFIEAYDSDEGESVNAIKRSYAAGGSGGASSLNPAYYSDDSDADERSRKQLRDVKVIDSDDESDESPERAAARREAAKAKRRIIEDDDDDDAEDDNDEVDEGEGDEGEGDNDEGAD